MEKKLSQTWKSVKKMTGTQNREVRKEYLSMVTMMPQIVQKTKPSKSIATVASFNDETASSSMDIENNLDEIPAIDDLMETRNNGIHSDGMCFVSTHSYIF